LIGLPSAPSLFLRCRRQIPCQVLGVVDGAIGSVPLAFSLSTWSIGRLLTVRFRPFLFPPSPTHVSPAAPPHDFISSVRFVHEVPWTPVRFFLGGLFCVKSIGTLPFLTFPAQPAPEVFDVFGRGMGQAFKVANIRTSCLPSFCFSPLFYLGLPGFSPLASPPPRCAGTGPADLCLIFPVVHDGSHGCWGSFVFTFSNLDPCGLLPASWFPYPPCVPVDLPSPYCTLPILAPVQPCCLLRPPLFFFFSLHPIANGVQVQPSFLRDLY